MNLVHLRPLAAALVGAAMVTLPGLLLRLEVPQKFEAGDPRIARTEALLARLQQECDPQSYTNEYRFSTTAQVTERRRQEILGELRLLQKDEPVLAVVRQRLNTRDTAEIGEMLQVVLLGMGDLEMVKPVAELMVLSEYPAVRICAARLLRKQHDEQTGDYFIEALRDTRFVRNDACGVHPGKYYPVRTIAALALREMNLYEPLNFDLD